MLFGLGQGLRAPGLPEHVRLADKAAQFLRAGFAGNFQDVLRHHWPQAVHLAAAQGPAAVGLVKVDRGSPVFCHSKPPQ